MCIIAWTGYSEIRCGFNHESDDELIVHIVLAHFMFRKKDWNRCAFDVDIGTFGFIYHQLVVVINQNHVGEKVILNRQKSLLCDAIPPAG